jgi:tetratricopeptide (TPR) repeat protein
MTFPRAALVLAVTSLASGAGARTAETADPRLSAREAATPSGDPAANDATAPPPGEAAAAPQGTTAPGQASAPDAARQSIAPLIARVDAAWPHRDERGRIDEIRSGLDEAERAAPDAYDVLWRQARLYFWLADDPALQGKDRSRLGKRAWDYGDRATKANPGGVEGWDYAAAGIGNYALGIGVFTALRQGIEGKFKDRLSRAEKIDPGFESGAIQTAWGRFWYELPWPKYDARRSEQALRAALARNPDNVRAHVYLADLYRKERRRDDALAELVRASSEQPGKYDAPEERRWQAEARRKLAE